MAKKVKISPKTGLLMSDVSFGIKGEVENSSIKLKEGKGKGDRPYSFADFSIDSHGHKLKIKVGGSKPNDLYVYDFDKKATEKINYVKNFIAKGEKANLIGIKYSTNVEGIDGELSEQDGIKCDFDFANSINGIISNDTYEVYGSIDFRRYKGDDGAMKMTKELKLNSIKRSKDDEELHHFDIKNFLFTKMVDKKTAEGYVLGYSEIIPVRLEVGNEGLAETLGNKKIVKPFTLMSVIGEISNKAEVEEPKKTDVKKGNWGEVTTSYGMAKSFAFMKLTILKVDPSTLNHGKITDKMLMEAIKKTNEVEDQYNSPVKDAKWGNEIDTPNLDEAKSEPVEKEEVKEAVKEVEKKVDKDDFDFDEWDD